MIFLETAISYLKGVGPQRAKLNEELSVFSLGDLIKHYPFRYIDRLKHHSISQVADQENPVQLKGRIISIKELGQPRKKRLCGFV